MVGCSGRLVQLIFAAACNLYCTLYVCVHIFVYLCICICVYLCICVLVFLCICIYCIVVKCSGRLVQLMFAAAYGRRPKLTSHFIVWSEEDEEEGDGGGGDGDGDEDEGDEDGDGNRNKYMRIEEG